MTNIILVCKKKLTHRSDWLFLCDSDLPLVIAGNMTVWDKFGSYEYASNYCRDKNSKNGQEYLIVILASNSK